MKRIIRLTLLVTWITLVGTVAATAQSGVLGFGFGGPMGMAFFPDMTGINTFMSENGMNSMGDSLFGAGGSGRGGVIGGVAAGGIGWGLVAETSGQDRHAELVFGGGGFDMGAAIGGDSQSVLTFGAVLGAGATVLSIDGYLVETVTPEGLVPEPTSRELGRVVGFVQPYVSMAARLLPWMGFEFRLGYVLPVFGIDFGDQLGVPAPSLRLSGPTVSLGIMFGGIGSASSSPAEPSSGRYEEVSQTSSGSFVIDVNGELMIENALGDVVISSYAPEPNQTASYIVEWQATRTASQRKIDSLQVQMDATEDASTLSTSGDGRVDYVLRIPSGVDVKVRNGSGDVTLVGHEAMTVILENGAGNIHVESVQAAALIVSGGVGRIDLHTVDAQTLIADLGLGEITLDLPSDTSATLMAKARIGEVAIGRFPAMIGGVHGLIGQSGDVTLGTGQNRIELTTGVGRIDVGVAM